VFLAFMWELDYKSLGPQTLKQQCIDIVDVWKNIGKPHSGEINLEMLKCKHVCFISLHRV